MAVKVRLKDASGEILHPETEWSVILGVPTANIYKYTYEEEHYDTILIHLQGSGPNSGRGLDFCLTTNGTWKQVGTSSSAPNLPSVVTTN